MHFVKPNLSTIILFLSSGIIALLFCFALPVYQGPDEQIHYATIQYRAEPKEKTWPITYSTKYEDGQGIDRYHLSEEVIAGGIAVQFDNIKWQEANTQTFMFGTQGMNEEVLRSTSYKRYIDLYPVHASPNTSYYYWIASWLEHTFSFLDFIERFFLMRFLSFLLYLGTVFLVYQTAKKIFSTRQEQFLFTLIVSLQPMLIATGVIVNIDIALIIGSALFFLGALKVITKASLKGHIILASGLLLAFLGKASGIAFVPVYILIYLFFFQQKYQLSYQKIIRSGFYAGSALLLLIFFSVPKSILATFLSLGAPSKFSSPLHSLAAYFDKTINPDAFLRTYQSYWGNFGWLDTSIHTPVLYAILIVEIIAWASALWYLFFKDVREYLPKKEILLLSFGTIFFLQLTIRFYDWRVFDGIGKVVIGAPGRYFLPTLLPHLLIDVTGLGFLLTRKHSEFITLLKYLAIGMLLFCLYTLFDIIIPRYYL